MGTREATPERLDVASGAGSRQQLAGAAAKALELLLQFQHPRALLREVAAQLAPPRVRARQLLHEPPRPPFQLQDPGDVRRRRQRDVGDQVGRGVVPVPPVQFLAGEGGAGLERQSLGAAGLFGAPQQVRHGAFTRCALSYSPMTRRRISLSGIASFVLTIPLVLLANLPTRLDRVMQLLNHVAPLGYWILIGAPIVAGAGAIVKRHRFWWLGLAGATISATLLGQWIWFMLTFKGKGW